MAWYEWTLETRKPANAKQLQHHSHQLRNKVFVMKKHVLCTCETCFLMLVPGRSLGKSLILWAKDEESALVAVVVINLLIIIGCWHATANDDDDEEEVLLRKLIREAIEEEEEGEFGLNI